MNCFFSTYAHYVFNALYLTVFLSLKGDDPGCTAYALGMIGLCVRDARIWKRPGLPRIPAGATERWTRNAGPRVNIVNPYPEM